MNPQELNLYFGMEDLHALSYLKFVKGWSTQFLDPLNYPSKSKMMLSCLSIADSAGSPGLPAGLASKHVPVCLTQLQSIL